MKIFNFFKKKKREKDEIHYCNKSEDSEEVKSIDIKELENLMNEITSCNILILNKANEIINYMVDKKFRRVFKRINELHEIKDKILNLSRKMYGYETENEIVKICIDGIIYECENLGYKFELLKINVELVKIKYDSRKVAYLYDFKDNIRDIQEGSVRIRDELEELVDNL